MEKPAITEEEKALIEKLHDLESAYWQVLFALRDSPSDPISIVKQMAWKRPSTWDFIALLPVEKR